MVDEHFGWDIKLIPVENSFSGTANGQIKVANTCRRRERLQMAYACDALKNAFHSQEDPDLTQCALRIDECAWGGTFCRAGTVVS